MAFREYGILELADRLNLDYNSGGNIHCPFCSESDRERRNLHLDEKTNYWRCNKCNTSGGVLHLFSLLYLGYEYSGSKKNEICEKLAEFMGDKDSTYTPRDRIIKEKPPVIPVADDDRLHVVYNAMLQIPALQLLPEHRKALLARGLSSETIDRNQYRSIPEQYDIPDFYNKLYEKAGGETLRTSLFEWYSPRNVKFGLMIAHVLISAGHELAGIPGFYRFGDHWCFWNYPGILIPTRNLKGQIVIWQVRKKKGEPKYITLTNGSLPGAVTGSVSRCHVPLGNAKLGTNCSVCYTEGPLKADVACELNDKPVIFLAIPGISTTKDLLVVLKELATKYQYKQVFNCLDMDRLTNPNVRSGSRKLIHEIRSLDIRPKLKVTDMYWGATYAGQKLQVVKTLARLRQVSYRINPGQDVFKALEIVSEALFQSGVNPFKEERKNGRSFYWEPETKGIDDFYFSLIPSDQQ